MTISRERLTEVLHYNPVTGIFTWKVARRPYKAFRVAGYVGTLGYIMIGIDGRKYTAHRLAWLYMTGEWPAQVDHVDMNKSNNAWANLRIGGYPENNANKAVRADSLSGIKGVYKYPDRKKRPWNAKIRFNNKQYNLGYFATKEEASDAYYEAAVRFYGEYARRA